MDFKTLIQSAFGTMVRHGVNALGALLISKGLIDSAQAASITDALYGIGLVLFAAVWSIVAKKKALNTPV